MKALALRGLRRLLDPTEQRLPLVVLQGVLVCVLGLSIVLTDYVRNGFKWPAEFDR